MSKTRSRVKGPGGSSEKCGRMARNFDFGILEEGSSVGIVKERVVDVAEVAAVGRLIMKCGRGMG